MTPKSRKYSIDDLNALIERVKQALNLTEEQISAKMGYNEGYIAQTRARGQVSDKFMDALKREFGASQPALHFAARIAAKAEKGQEPAQDKPDQPLTIQALFNLTESNRVLAESNKSLADSHQVLVGMVKGKFTAGEPEEIPAAVQSKLTDLLGLIAEVGSGKKWKSPQEAAAELHKRFSGAETKTSSVGIHAGTGRSGKGS
jgi:hypothetical protein